MTFYEHKWLNSDDGHGHIKRYYKIHRMERRRVVGIIPDYLSKRWQNIYEYRKIRWKQNCQID